MRYRDDIYTILVGLGLVIYGASQVAFKAAEHRRWQLRWKAEQVLKSKAIEIPQRER